MGGVRRPLFPSGVTWNARGTVNPGMEADAPQAWQRGSPEADHAPKAMPEPG